MFSVGLPSKSVPVTSMAYTHITSSFLVEVSNPGVCPISRRRSKYENTFGGCFSDGLLHFRALYLEAKRHRDDFDSKVTYGPSDRLRY